MLGMLTSLLISVALFFISFKESLSYLQFPESSLQPQSNNNSMSLVFMKYSTIASAINRVSDKRTT